MIIDIKKSPVIFILKIVLSFILDTDLPNVYHIDDITSSVLRVEVSGKVKIHFTNLQSRFK